MNVLMLLGAVSLLLSLLITPLCRFVFLCLGIVDHPDQDRKIHKEPVPRVGGVAIALSYGGALAILTRLSPYGQTLNVQHRHLMLALAPAMTVVFLTGLMDDLWTLRPWQKLSGQLLASVLAVMAGVRINFFDGHAPGAFLAVPLTVALLVVYSNAFNLIDGMDGLAAGVGLFASVTTLLAAALQGDWGLATATAPLVGCLLGFLFYNFNPASVFLGDSGSLSVGFLLGCFGVIWSEKSATFLGLCAPLMALALPLMDTVLSIGRRILRNKPVFSPDRGHIHHRLLAQGLHPRSAVLILYAACAVGAILSLLQSAPGYHLQRLCILAFCAMSWFAVKRLSYVEFRAASRVLRSGGILHLIQQEIYLHGLRELLLEARTPRDYWRVVRNMCQDLHFRAVEFSFGEQSFQDVFDSDGAGSAWEFALPLGDNGRIRLSLPTAKKQSARWIGAVFLLQECLRGREYLTATGGTEPDDEFETVAAHATAFEHTQGLRRAAAAASAPPSE